MMRFIPPISLIAFIVVQINAASLPRPQTNSIPASPAPPLVEPARALPTKSPDTNAPSSTPVYQRPRAAINTVRPTSTGAEATYGRHKVQFANDAASPRPIIIVTPGGEKLSSRASFLALYDRASDQTQLIGGITNATGRITSASQVTYSNAFDTIKAHLRYDYDGKAGSLAQDIILEEQPALPAGWQSSNVVLQVWTEWFESEPLSTESRSISLRANSNLPVSDQSIDFGTMKIVAGKCFSLQTPETNLPVAKTWTHITGADGSQRTFLIENIDYLSIKSSLDPLPQAPQTSSLHPRGSAKKLIAGLSTPSSRKSRSPMLFARTESADARGLVLDFIIISSVPAPSGLVAWWPAGGNALDATANHNDGTLYNGATFAAGEVGQAFSFDGSAAHVRVPDSAGLNFTNAITIDAWIYPTNYDSYSDIVSKWHATGSGQDSFDFSVYPGGQVYILVSSDGAGSGMAYVLTTNSVPLNQWTHVAGTYDGSGLRVYLNGVLDASGAYANGIFPGTIDLGIGGVVGAANPGDVISQFSGQIDEPSIYNRALSATEIQTIYNAGGAGKYNPNCVSASTNAVGWWGGDGNAYDLAHTNMGTLQNGATFASGEVGQGFKFDGVDDYVRIENNSDLNPTNQLTLECWVFLDSYYYDNYALIRKDGECANRQYMLTASPAGTFRAHLGIQSGGYNYVDSSIFPQEKTWYHLAETYDGTNLCLYINGVLDSSTNLTGQIVTTSEPLCIGGTAPNGCREYFTGGLIDEPAVYNRALSATEIGAIYSAGCAGKCKVDSDSDGLTDLQEAFLGTNPNNPDTDGDGLTDGDEVFVYHTNPNSQDSDGDGVIDQPFGIFITRPRTGSSLP